MYVTKHIPITMYITIFLIKIFNWPVRRLGWDHPQTSPKSFLFGLPSYYRSLSSQEDVQNRTIEATTTGTCLRRSIWSWCIHGTHRHPNAPHVTPLKPTSKFRPTTKGVGTTTNYQHINFCKISEDLALSLQQRLQTFIKNIESRDFDAKTFCREDGMQQSFMTHHSSFGTIFSRLIMIIDICSSKRWILIF